MVLQENIATVAYHNSHFSKVGIFSEFAVIPSRFLVLVLLINA